MTTKDYLNQISYYNKIIDNKLIEITQYKELSYSISAVVNEELYQRRYCFRYC